MKCHFCGSTAVHSCDWLVEKPADISHWDLTEDDIVVRPGSSTRPLALRRFNYREPRQHMTIPVTMFAFTAGEAARGFAHLVFLTGRDRVLILSPSVCGVACCEAHLREVGDKTHYCFEHWDSWQHVGVSEEAMGARV